MTSNTGDGGNSVLNSWESCVLSTCLELSGSATEDWPMCVIFCKFFPAFAASFKMGLIIHCKNVPGVESLCEEAWFHDGRDSLIYCLSQSWDLPRPVEMPYTCVERAESFTSFFSGCGRAENKHRLVPALPFIATIFLLQTDVPLEISSRSTP